MDWPRYRVALRYVAPPALLAYWSTTLLRYDWWTWLPWVCASVAWVSLFAVWLSRRILLTNEIGEHQTAFDWAAWKAERQGVIQDSYTRLEVEDLLRTVAVTAYSDALMFGDDQPMFQQRVGEMIHLPTGAVVDLRTADALTSALIKIVAAEHGMPGSTAADVNWADVAETWEDHVWPAFTTREKTAIMCAGIVAAGKAVRDASDDD